MIPFSSEFNLLLETSQVNPSTNSVDAILKETLNQEYLFNLAVANGTLPLLYAALSQHQQFEMSPYFKDESTFIAQKNFFMSAQLLHIIFKLREQNIEVIPLKGAVLAQHAYNNGALRPYSDIDILVQEKDLLRVADFLISLGYVNQEAILMLSHPFILKKFSDISFVHPVHHTIIELHWKLNKNDVSVLRDINALFENAIKISYQNQAFNSLPIEEEFIYLCMHASKHRWERLEWMNDINRLYERHQATYDWDKLLFIAQKENYYSAYFLGLTLLQKLFNQTIAHEPTATLMKNRKVDKLYKKVMLLHCQDYILSAKKSGMRYMELMFAIAVEDSLLKKLNIIKGIFFPLYTKDILSGPKLQKPFEVLYYFYRWIRIIKQKL